MALEIANVTKKFATHFTGNGLFHIRMTFEHMQLQMVLGPHCVSALRTNKVFHPRMNQKVLLETFFALEGFAAIVFSASKGPGTVD